MLLSFVWVNVWSEDDTHVFAEGGGGEGRGGEGRGGRKERRGGRKEGGGEPHSLPPKVVFDPKSGRRKDGSMFDCLVVFFVPPPSLSHLLGDGDKAVPVPVPLSLSLSLSRCDSLTHRLCLGPEEALVEVLRAELEAGRGHEDLDGHLLRQGRVRCGGGGGEAAPVEHLAGVDHVSLEWGANFNILFFISVPAAVPS